MTMKRAYINPETTVMALSAADGLLLPASPGGSTDESYSRRYQDYEDGQDIASAKPKDIWDDDEEEQTP